MTAKTKKTSALDAPQKNGLAQRYGRIKMRAVAAAARYQGTQSSKGAKQKSTAEQQPREAPRRSGQS